MGSSSEERDTLTELREGLAEDARPAAQPGPPPLPPRRTGPAPDTGKAPSVTPAAFRPAMSLPSVQASSRAASEAVTAPVRPVGWADPFAEPPEPRMPLGSAPEEKLEHFRSVLKQKTETLTRARALYSERESELQELRVSEATLRRQLTEAQEQLGALKDLPAKLEQASLAVSREAARTAAAEAKVTELQGELHTAEEDRKDLSRALAEVESELSRVTGELKHERSSRGALAEELVGAKEALSLAQDRVAELAAERAEMQGALEAVREQYQANLAELEDTGEQLRAAQRERELVAAERAGLSARVKQLETMLAESEGSSSSLEEAQARTRELEAELETARAEVAELASLRESLAVSEAEVVRLRDRMEADAAALSEAAEQAEAQVAELQAELRTVESDRQDLSRALADVEAELGRVREQVAQQEAKGEAEEELEVEELDAERRAQEAEEQVERLRQRVTMLEGALDASRNKGQASDEEAAARETLEARVAELEAELAEERERRAELEASAPEESGTSAELIAERDQLKEDVATMKRKLMAAETALEAAASYKMKVSRLEAQLAQLRGGK
ncbi:hypothetical protein F0U61_09950 [Archangium violaceum]|uniref:hypothetical protein n=1 Tax=Archangium violaceum TaxID=83451 RepID=UPI002B2B79C4|nr:hypothetical protein F0U61_09950 [Archangium violaceum]